MGVGDGEGGSQTQHQHPPWLLWALDSPSPALPGVVTHHRLEVVVSVGG